MPARGHDRNNKRGAWTGDLTSASTRSKARLQWSSTRAADTNERSSLAAGPPGPVFIITSLSTRDTGRSPGISTRDRLSRPLQLLQGEDGGRNPLTKEVHHV